MIRLRVREVAEEKGMSMGKLARAADIDTKTLRRIYRNPTSEISTVTLDKLARALGVDASHLLESIPE